MSEEPPKDERTEEYSDMVDESEYDEKRVDGLENNGPPLVFDEELRKVLEAESPIMNAIPRPFVAEDGTRMYFFSPTKEVELDVTGSPDTTEECINCNWEGKVLTENQPEEKENYASYCPNCGHQTLRPDNDE